jgi:hypothetical protein
MIVTEKVDVKSNKTKQYYLDKGYKLEDSYFRNVKIEDLHTGSEMLVECICDVCGRNTKIKYVKYLKNINNGGFYACSSKCSTKKKEMTLQKNYGEGITNPMKSEEVKKKSIDTNLKVYGVSHPMQSKEIQKKSIETVKIKYNVDNVSQSPIVRETIKRKYLEKYGVDNPLKSEDIKNKIKKTNNDKYGSDWYIKSEKFKEDMKNDLLRTNNNKYSKIVNNDEYEFILYEVDEEQRSNKLKIKHNKCCVIFTINTYNFYRRNNKNMCICTECYPISELNSMKEKEVCEFIESLGIEYRVGDRNILDGKELDIYLPKHNLAIEFNGLYWHSELFKDKNYHLDKSLKCQETGLFLIHIWEDEWVFKQDIVKSIILNRLGLIENSIYARNCEIRIVEDGSQVKDFLESNHIQGYAQSTIKLGLYYNDELVSLMTFGYRHTNAKKEFELIRFCNRKNLNVIGAASKLFDYLKNNYVFDKIITYSDFRMFDGGLYEKLGFVKKHLSKPDYFWCNDIERNHRFNFNKQKLIKEGYDSNKTESEIMHERGYFRLYSCGQYRWEYEK